MAKLMDNDKAKEWNKAQADLLRAVADRIEAGEYYSLAMDNTAAYALFASSPENPAKRYLALKVEYWEQENRRG